MNQANQSLSIPAFRWSGTAFWQGVWMLCCIFFLLGPTIAWASPTQIIQAELTHQSGEWHVSVTLRHADTGWKHYADVWVVEDLTGMELGRRVLLHPHVEEQPFTRSLRIVLPKSITKIQIRAGDNIEGLNSNVIVVDLTKLRGQGYKIIRP